MINYQNQMKDIIKNSKYHKFQQKNIEYYKYKKKELILINDIIYIYIKMISLIY